MRKPRGKGLTIVGVVEVDDFLPTVVSHRIDDSAMVIRPHTYGEVQETRGRRQDLRTIIPSIHRSYGVVKFSIGNRVCPPLNALAELILLRSEKQSYIETLI